MVNIAGETQLKEWAGGRKKEYFSSCYERSFEARREEQPKKAEEAGNKAGEEPTARIATPNEGALRAPKNAGNFGRGVYE